MLKHSFESRTSLQKKEVKKICGRDVTCIFFRHDDFENQELYCSTKWVKVIEEGVLGDFVNEVAVVAEILDDDDPNNQPVIPDEVFRAGNLVEHIA